MIFIVCLLMFFTIPIGSDADKTPKEVESQVQRNFEIVKSRVELLHFIYRSRTKKDLNFWITSGVRSFMDNQRVGGAKSSAHLSGQAIDIAYETDRLAGFVLKNVWVLKVVNLYMAHPATSRHIHFTTRPPKSKRRIFYPYKIIKKSRLKI